MDVPDNEKITYQDIYPVTTETKNINRLRIRLEDEFGDLIQTRSDYTMILNFIDTEPEG